MSKVYNWLCNNVDQNNQISVSGSMIAKKTGLSIKSVRMAIKSLTADGIIKVQNNISSETGAVLCNTMTVLKKPTPIPDSRIQIAMYFYNDMVSKRTGKKKRFNSQSPYKNNFKSMVQMCMDMNMDDKLYIRAVFNCMPKKWCMKVFGQPYPDPPLLINKSKAETRYTRFISEIRDRYISYDAEFKETMDGYSKLISDMGCDTEESIFHLVVMELIPLEFYIALGFEKYINSELTDNNYVSNKKLIKKIRGYLS